MSDIQLRPFDPESDELDAAMRVHATVWERNVKQTLRFYLSNAEARDYHGRVAFIGQEAVGMGFGTRSEKGQWWHDQVAEQVGAGHPALQDAWVLVELAVLRAYRRRGVGRLLVDALLEAQPCTNALLSTLVTNQSAVRFYERYGWRILHPGFSFLRGDPAYLIMHRRLR